MLLNSPVCPPTPHEYDRAVIPPQHLTMMPLPHPSGLPPGWNPAVMGYPQPMLIPSPQSTPPSPRNLRHGNYSPQSGPINQPTTHHHAPPIPPRPVTQPPPYSTRQPPERDSRPRRQILFYNKHDPHYGFTNFSPHPVVYKGRKYPTSEHLFQASKFAHRPDLAEHIRTYSDRPSAAFSEARRFAPEVRPDWLNVNVGLMDEIIWLKFTQHQSLKEELLATGDAELVEDSDKDAFWGIGADRKGRNELGLALERLRERLRKQTNT